MSGARGGRSGQARQRIAQEAARIISEEGVEDYRSAKQKAARHLGNSDSRNMPTNVEVEEALKAHNALFRGDDQASALRSLREHALMAMDLLKDFTPRAVGSVVSGTADRLSVLRLHAFSDSPEEIAFRLMEAGIPYHATEHSLKFSPGERKIVPAYEFIADDVPVQISVFPQRALHHPPLSPVDGKPMQRMSASDLDRLLDSPCPVE